MLVRQLMTTQVECITPDTAIAEAAKKMALLNVGPLPVCDHGRLVGMLTDRDIVVRAIAVDLDPRTTQARQIMTPQTVFCYDDQDVREAMKLMKENEVRRVLVLDRDQNLIGIISLGDIAEGVDDPHSTGATLQAVSEPAAPMR